MDYTDKQIAAAFENYFRRTDRVMEVLRLAPLNAYGIYTVVNVSPDFMVVNIVTQRQVDGAALSGTVEDKINLCRELILRHNPQMPKDVSLVEPFVGIPLDAEKNPFFFAAYGQDVFDSVVSKAEKEEEMSKALLMRTKQGVPFYLALEDNINEIFPARIRWSPISVMLSRGK
jgi:hypothetical protein